MPSTPPTCLTFAYSHRHVHGSGRKTRAQRTGSSIDDRVTYRCRPCRVAVRVALVAAEYDDVAHAFSADIAEKEAIYRLAGAARRFAAPSTS
jgi:hypothetical protein